MRCILSRFFVVIVVWIVTTASTALAQTTDKLRELRQRMVTECIEREGIHDSRVLAAMRTVPRHEFVKPIGNDVS